MNIVEHEMKKCQCLVCGETLELTTPAYGNKKPRPKPGDVSVCIRCGNVMAFTNDLGVRELTAEEQKLTEADSRLAFLLEVRAAFMKERLQ